MGKLDGKVALITGGSDGIGLATAQLFLDEGVEHLFITGRRQNVLDQAVKTLGSERVTTVRGDISNLADLDELFRVIKEKKGRLDILFANAAVFVTEPIATVTEQHYDLVFNTNVKGLVFTVQKALPILTDGASIVLNASIGSVKGYANESVYSASKAAVRSLARTWSVDLKDRHIRVNAVSPGPIDTPMLRNGGNTEDEKQAYLDACAAATVLNRLGKPEEIGKAVLFLASNDSSYVTGIELFVDGGLAQI